jgi:conjugal transfer pilus assembly protein TraI
LKPVVHAALAEIVAKLLHSPSSAEAELTPEALFVPLAAFERRGLDTALVVDSLDSAGLLHRTAHSAKTARATFAGESCLGVLVKGSHIAGFPARSQEPA